MHLLGVQGMPASQLRAVLARARHYEPEGQRAVTPARETAGRVLDVLRGVTVANLFFEDSTRTRMSFSLAARRLGAHVVDLTSSDSSVNKGETIRDTAANVAAMGVDAMVVRHRASGAAALVARAVGATWGTCVVNAGDGKHEHPTQGMLDSFTISECFGRLEDFDLSGLKIAIVGDVASSRVARSDIAAMTTLGAEVIVVGPPHLAPPSLRVLGCGVCHDLDEVIDRVDAVNVLRIQFERAGGGGGGPGERVGGATLAKAPNVVSSVREYAELYGLSLRRAERMKKGAVILHPGPINRGVEMTAAVADGDRSVVLRQVGHGVAVRMAVLELCLGARS
ncbi:MAG: aspartate carbamoyltransferase catalytic subunit [Phycisphaerales bacterium]